MSPASTASVIKKAAAKIEAHPNYKRRGPSHTDAGLDFLLHARRRRAGDSPGVAALRVADHYERSDSLGRPRRFHAGYMTLAPERYAGGETSDGPGSGTDLLGPQHYR